MCTGTSKCSLIWKGLYSYFKLRLRPQEVGVSSNATASVITRIGGRRRLAERAVETEARMREISYKPRNAKDCQ